MIADTVSASSRTTTTMRSDGKNRLGEMDHQVVENETTLISAMSFQDQHNTISHSKSPTKCNEAITKLDFSMKLLEHSPLDEHLRILCVGFMRTIHENVTWSVDLCNIFKIYSLIMGNRELFLYFDHVGLELLRKMCILLNEAKETHKIHRIIHDLFNIYYHSSSDEVIVAADRWVLNVIELIPSVDLLLKFTILGTLNENSKQICIRSINSIFSKIPSQDLSDNAKYIKKLLEHAISESDEQELSDEISQYFKNYMTICDMTSKDHVFWITKLTSKKQELLFQLVSNEEELKTLQEKLAAFRASCISKPRRLLKRFSSSISQQLHHSSDPAAATETTADSPGTTNDENRAVNIPPHVPKTRMLRRTSSSFQKYKNVFKTCLKSAPSESSPASDATQSRLKKRLSIPLRPTKLKMQLLL